MHTTPELLQHGPPPIPTDPWEWQRWQHTAQRRRILGGVWQQDLEVWLQQHLGQVRRQITGPQDLSSNVLKTITTQLSILYDRGRPILHSDGPLPELLASGSRSLQLLLQQLAQQPGQEWLADVEPVGTRAGAMARAGWNPLMQRIQRMVLGCNEYGVHLSWSKRGGLLYRPVPPDRVCAAASPERPDEPVHHAEARLWLHPKRKGKVVWVWETHNIEDLERPYYEVRTASPGPRGRPETLLAYEGEKYPWRFETMDDEPFIPVVLYHRERSGELWDPFEGREVVDGTLTVAMLWTYFVHGVRDASWVQRFIANLQLAGAASGADGEDLPPVASLPSDPASIMVLMSPEDLPQGATPIVGQWAAPFAPDLIGLAIARFEERLAQYVGVSPTDLVRASGDPRSGYALAVSNAGLEKSQLKFGPQFDAGDQEAAAKSAAILNLNRPEGAPLLPEQDYQAFTLPLPQTVPTTSPSPEPAPAAA